MKIATILLVSKVFAEQEEHAHEEGLEEGSEGGSEEGSESASSYQCRDLVTFKTCISRLLFGECSFNEIQCRRTCGRCSSGNQQDYCYDAMLDLDSWDIATSPLAQKRVGVDTFGGSTTNRYITNMCWSVFRNTEEDQSMIEEYFYNLGLYDMAFGKDFSCAGLGGRLCGYTCGQCKEQSTVDGSGLDCYAKWNRQQEVYQEMRSFIVLDTDLSCPLNGKSARTDASVANGGDSEDEDYESEDEEWGNEDDGNNEEQKSEEENDENISENETDQEKETDQDEHDNFDHDHEMQNDAINVAENIKKEDSEGQSNFLSSDIETEDLLAIEAVLEQSISAIFSSCRISRKYGPRKITVECQANCESKNKQFVSLSKHNGQTGGFSFSCMGQWGKRYCVSENCGGGRPGANYQCNRCSLQFACVDNAEDIDEVIGKVPTDCQDTQFVANF